ncbi:unnamed protein product, partial [Ixodes hexagonus]
CLTADLAPFRVSFVTAPRIGYVECPCRQAPVLLPPGTPVVIVPEADKPPVTSNQNTVVVGNHLGSSQPVVAVAAPAPVVPVVQVAQAVPVAPVGPPVPVVPVVQMAPVAPVAQAVPVAQVVQAVPVAPVAQAVPVAPV